jgi:hypothetical protein
MSITICTIARNENEHIEEFFIYYREVLGCARIIFFDDSDDDIQKNICSYYSDYVTYVRLPPGINGHTAANNLGLELCDTRYIGFFDADEFLALKRHRSLDDYIADTFVDDIRIVYFNWRIFTSMGYKTDPPELVTSSYTRCLPPKKLRVELGPEQKWRPHGMTKYIVDVKACRDAGVHSAVVEGDEYFANDSGGYDTVQLNHYQSKSMKSVIIRDMQSYKFGRQSRKLNVSFGKRGTPFWRLKTYNALNEYEQLDDDFMLQYSEKINSLKRVNYKNTFELLENTELPDLSEFDLSNEEKDMVHQCLKERAVCTLEPKESS